MRKIIWNVRLLSNSNFLFLLSLNLISLVAFMLIVSAIGFGLNISISTLHFPLSLFLAAIVTWLATKFYFPENAIKIYLCAILLLMVIYLPSFCIAANFYDYSYDGQTYHQSMVISMRHGWSPFYEETYEDGANAVWVNHYAKGAEIPQAVLYSFFEKIEIGKSTNVLIFLASFFIAYATLKTGGLKSGLKPGIIAGLAASNTVSIFLLLTYYNDGIFGSLLLCFLCSIVLLYKATDIFKFFVFVCLFVLLLNVKFPAIVFSGIPVVGLLAFLAFVRNWKLFRQVFIVSGVTTAVSLLLVGFNPYVRNTVNRHHPFFPVAGEGKIDIMIINRPRFFDDKSNVEKFLLSLFSRTADPIGYDKPQFKIPFTFSLDELKFNYQSRAGGFGFWFSGIFCLAAVLMLYLFYYYLISKKKAQLFLLSTFVIGFALSILVFPEPWWARFVPHVWLFPVAIVVFAEFAGSRFTQKFVYAILFFMLGNVGHTFVHSMLLNREATKMINQQLDEMKQSPAGVAIDCGFFGSNKVRLAEHGIPYIEEKLVDDPTASPVHFSESRYKILPSKL